MLLIQSPLALLIGTYMYVKHTRTDVGYCYNFDVGSPLAMNRYSDASGLKVGSVDNVETDTGESKEEEAGSKSDMSPKNNNNSLDLDNNKSVHIWVKWWWSQTRKWIWRVWWVRKIWH